ncbi:hypothetical protein [Thermoactinospora rubra]|uniref:hypothetical protein n=1 Tax=Thermoactinospora rubra TaxID=1088767 RepID=UPI000A106036|nr:hypothetical protein [Thermoactinospora rubra]
MSDRRTALITGLRDLADFLEANPDVPASPYSLTFNTFPAKGPDAEMCAEVDKVAALLGSEIDPDHLPHGHYTTVRWFGPVEYRFTAILAAARARYRAEDSYRGCIQPDTDTGGT